MKKQTLFLLCLVGTSSWLLAAPNYYPSPGVTYQAHDPNQYYLPCDQEIDCCQAYAPSPCDNTCCDPSPYFSCYNPLNCFLLGVEFGSNALYWRSISEGVQYATIQNLVASSLPQYTTPKSRFGYDIWGEAILFNPCFTLAGRYVSYNGHSRASVSSAGAIIPVFSPLFGVNQDFGSGEVRDKYRSGDIEARWSLAPCCALSGALLGGLRYFDITQKEDYLYINGATETPAMQNLSYRGWGPRLGLKFNFDPLMNRCCPLNVSLRGHVAAMVAIGDRRNLLDTITGQFFPQGDLLFPKRRAITPAMDFRLELVGEWHICNFFVSARIGYEQNYYFSGFTRIETANTIGIVPRSEIIVGFGGPFAGVSIGY